MITLGSRVRLRHGAPRIVGIVVRLWGIWIEVVWPNGETGRYDETALEVVDGNA